MSFDDAPDGGQFTRGDRAEAPDRLEREADAFFETIAGAYDELADAEPDRITVIDAAQPAERVLADAVDALADLV